MIFGHLPFAAKPFSSRSNGYSLDTGSVGNAAVEDDAAGAGVVAIAGIGGDTVDDQGAGTGVVGSAPVTGIGGANVDDQASGNGTVPATAITGMGTASADEQGLGSGIVAPLSVTGTGSATADDVASGGGSTGGSQVTPGYDRRYMTQRERDYLRRMEERRRNLPQRYEDPEALAAAVIDANIAVAILKNDPSTKKAVSRWLESYSDYLKASTVSLPSNKIAERNDAFDWIFHLHRLYQDDAALLLLM